MQNNMSLPRGPRVVVNAYLITAMVVFVLMMSFGLLMRLEQGEIIQLGPAGFYQLLTAHGAGMVGISALASSTVMWYYLRQYVSLSTGIFLANYILFLCGAVAILGSVFFGKFAAAWTFLYPLPATSMGLWDKDSAAIFFIGLLLIGIGFLLLYLDIARALLKSYGSLGQSLGIPQMLGKENKDTPPATVIASTMVLIVNTLGIIGGAVILLMSLINLYQPDFEIDPLFAKNLIFFFGHVFINATIYMAIIGVYEILPRYSGRSWKVSRIFIAGWVASTIMVLIVYPHHILMDFAQPTFLHIIGQVISYTSGLPVLFVTAYGAITNILYSGLRWSLAPSLLFLGVFGWAAGVIPAIIDATVIVNSVMHNTLWVPGHFHFYLLLGVVAMFFGFTVHISQHEERIKSLWDRAGFWLFMIGGITFVNIFLYSGSISIPRRYAEYLAEWTIYAQAGAFAAGIIIIGTLIIAGRCIFKICQSTHES